ncbi:DUF654-domain-containing protein, partial [Clavulina sp. PMI_390]
KKKKPKRPSEASAAVDFPASPVAVPTPPTSPPSKKERKAKRKEDQLDEIDQALMELGIKGGPTPAPKSGESSGPAIVVSSAVTKFRELLATSPKHLDGDAELRRFFGSKVVRIATNHLVSQPAKQRRAPVVRSQLTTPPPTWYMVRLSQGLTMRPSKETEVWRKIGAYPGDKWWTLEHSTSYKTVELLFLETVQMGDYEGFMRILQKHPWHVDTLLQMSEVARHQDGNAFCGTIADPLIDNTQASDLVARALFAIERAFPPSFNITTGTQRLDFDRIENRPFFMTLARYIVNLQKRGTNRAAFEFARLLLSLDPGEDPHGALLYLDYLAVRSGMNQWLLDMWVVWEQLATEERFTPGRADIRLLPGWSWARALAMRNVEDEKGDRKHERSTRLLEDAFCTYPYVLPLLADKAGINLSSELRAHPDLRISTSWDSFAKGESTLHLLSHLYTQRSFELWKVPEIAEWIRSTITPSLLQHLSSPSPALEVRRKAITTYGGGTPENFVRHVIVAENRSAMAFFHPGAVPQQMVSFDPLPPRTSLSQYDQDYFRGVMVRERRGRASGGGAGGAAEVDDGDQLALQEFIMREIQRGRPQPAGAIPGAFPGGQVHEGDVDDFDEEETVDLERDQDNGEDDEDGEEDEEVCVRLDRNHPFTQNPFFFSVRMLLQKRGAGCRDCTTCFGAGAMAMGQRVLLDKDEKSVVV